MRAGQRNTSWSPDECQLVQPAALRGVPPIAKVHPEPHLPLKSRTLRGFSARGIKGLPERGQSSLKLSQREAGLPRPDTPGRWEEGDCDPGVQME